VSVVRQESCTLSMIAALCVHWLCLQMALIDVEAELRFHPRARWVVPPRRSCGVLFCMISAGAARRCSV